MDESSGLLDALRSFDPRLLAYLIELARLCLWLVLLTVLFTPLERLFALHPERILRKAVLTDLAYYFLNSLLPGVLLGIPLACVAWLVHAVIPPAFTGAVAQLPIWMRLLASFLVGEVGFYWGHRWSHELPFLWRFHAIHHSAEHMDFLVNTRAHPVDIVFTRLCGLAPLFVLGLAAPNGRGGTLIPVLITLLGIVWGFFIHANLRWRFGVLEWIVATPAFHHWHHTNDSPDLHNKNYSPLLPGIDRLFGTLYLPAGRQPRVYGIDEPTSPSLFGQLIDPFLPRKRPETPVPEPTQQPAIGTIPDPEIPT